MITEPENLPKLIERLRETVPGLRAVWLFGSMASGTTNARSDLDLAVLADDECDCVDLFDVAQELAMLAWRDVDLIDLWTASTVLRYEIVGKGRICWSDHSDEVERFADDVYSMYLHFNQERAALLADIRSHGTIYAR